MFESRSPVSIVLVEEAYTGEFAPVANVSNAWRKSIDVDGSDFVVVAVQTQR